MDKTVRTTELEVALGFRVEGRQRVYTTRNKDGEPVRDDDGKVMQHAAPASHAEQRMWRLLTTPEAQWGAQADLT